MNLVADESVDHQIVERLRQDGHEVLYVAEVEPSIADDVVLERANESSALLVTADKDFGELVFRDKLLTMGGVIPLRLTGIVVARKAEIVSAAFTEHAAEFSNHFSVISPGRIRIRSTI
jgi:predicted nuclease of predicted toxin-antitoxin system